MIGEFKVVKSLKDNTVIIMYTNGMKQRITRVQLKDMLEEQGNTTVEVAPDPDPEEELDFDNNMYAEDDLDIPDEDEDPDDGL